MSEQHIHKELSQTDKLIRYLRNGHSTNFLDAFHRFGVQDLRKRICEIRDFGYQLTAGLTRPKVGEYYATMLQHGDKVPLVKSYRMVDPLKPGDYVQVVSAPSVFGVSPLKGHMGTVQTISADHWHSVADAQGNVFGRFRHKALKRLGSFRQGQEVGLKKHNFTVHSFNTEDGKYILTNGDICLSAPADALHAWR